MDKFIVINGNPADGLNFWGPFDTHEAAVEWAEHEISDSWSVAPLDFPIAAEED